MGTVLIPGPVAIQSPKACKITTLFVSLTGSYDAKKPRASIKMLHGKYSVPTSQTIEKPQGAPGFSYATAAARANVQRALRQFRAYLMAA
jgi:hypothetical protein